MAKSSIASAINKVCEAVGPVVRMTGFNPYDKYPYAKLDDYIRAIHGACAEHGVVLTSSVGDVIDLQPRKSQRGGDQYAVRVTVALTATCVETGETITITAPGEGQDRGDKAVYKAITGARKYAYAMMFNLGTSDDPEVDETGETNETAPPPTPDIPDDLLEYVDQLHNVIGPTYSVMDVWQMIIVKAAGQVEKIDKAFIRELIDNAETKKKGG